MSLSAEEVERIVTSAMQRTVGHNVSVSRGGGDGGFRKLIDGLLILGVAAMVAIVWRLSNNVSVLTIQVSYLSAEVQALRTR